MRRVAVVGCSGAGKTTFARDLGARLRLPVVHGDFLGRTGGERAQGSRWEAVHAEAIAGDTWILDAMRLSTLEARLRRADTVIFLDLPRRSCLTGIVRRRLRHRAVCDPGSGVADRINLELLRWIWGFRDGDRRRVLAALASHGDTTRVVVLRSREETRRFLSSLG